VAPSSAPSAAPSAGSGRARGFGGTLDSPPYRESWLGLAYTEGLRGSRSCVLYGNSPPEYTHSPHQDSRRSPLALPRDTAQDRPLPAPKWPQPFNDVCNCMRSFSPHAAALQNLWERGRDGGVPVPEPKCAPADAHSLAAQQPALPAHTFWRQRGRNGARQGSWASSSIRQIAASPSPTGPVRRSPSQSSGRDCPNTTHITRFPPLAARRLSHPEAPKPYPDSALLAPMTAYNGSCTHPRS